jgi:L-seryl-tRNA(Ser) seleniumtransferase
MTRMTPTPEQKSRLRELPSVSELLADEEVVHWIGATSRTLVVESLQESLEAARRRILNGDDDLIVDRQAILETAEDLLWKKTAPSLRRVINATGIILHTGLGRAPLCSDAIEAIVEAAGGYCNLELDLETGERGRRERHLDVLLRRVTGAEAATAVNNNAAATLLILNTLAKDREVIVSRGQLIEIGGSFRLPEIMAASGARLCEVGTTNRTRIGDYAAAINEHTAAILRVHTSNYRIAGFSEETPLEELADLARRSNLPLIDDLGSGALVDLAALGLSGEPVPSRSVAAGADLVCFSADKLLGGPQAGIIAGRRDIVANIERNPLMRTYRLDKLVLLALEATLRHYVDERTAIGKVPALAMMAAPTEKLSERAQALCGVLEQNAPGEAFFVCSDTAYAGGGALPTVEIPSVCVQWRPQGVSIHEAMRILRDAETPVVARVKDEAICFDLRTVTDEEFEDLAAGVSAVLMECEDDNEDEDGPSTFIQIGRA